MILLAFFYLGKASLPYYDCILNLSSSDYYLYLKTEGIEIRNSSSTKNNSVVYLNENLINGTIYVNLGIFTDSNHILYLATENTNPCNLNVSIENINMLINHLEISFYKSCWSSITNSINITFNAAYDFLYFRDIINSITLKIFTLIDKQIIAYFPHGNKEKIMICYSGLNCTSQDDFTIQPDETYLSLINEDYLQNFVSSFISNTELKYIRFLFVESLEEITFPIFVMQQIQQFELIGLSKQHPNTLKLTDGIDTKLVPNWIIQNIQFSTESSASKFSFQKVLIIDTFNVFPNQGTFTIDTTYEYRKSGSSNSYFQNVPFINNSIFEISPDFESNGDITLTIENSEITITGNSEELLTTIPFLQSTTTSILIKNQQNRGKNKIQIKPNKPFKPFSMRIENCDLIPIEFSDWSDPSYNDFIFDFYTSKNDDITLALSNSDCVKYRHYDLEKTRLFSEFPVTERNIVFCLHSEKCEQSEFFGSEFVQIPISGENLTTVTSNFHKKLDELKDIDFLQFILIMNRECDAIELDLSPYLQGQSLNTFKIINKEEAMETIGVTLKSFPKAQNIFWEVNKIHIASEISTNESYAIKELLSINDGRIEDERIKIEKTSYIENVDLTVSDQTITISEDQIEYLNVKVHETDKIKFIIKTTSSSLHKLIFEPKTSAQKTCDISVDFEAFDENSFTIPIHISDQWNQLQSDQIGSIQINVVNSEHIVFNSNPEKVFVKVYNKEETPRLLAQTPKYSSAINICYNSDQCTAQPSFSLNDNEILLSTRSEEEFSNLMKSFVQNSNKFFSNFTLSFVNSGDNFNVKFEDIPSDQIGVLYLKGFSNPSILLTEETKTEDIKCWFIDKVTFKVDPNLTKVFYFQRITVNSTYNVFPSSSNFKFGIARSIIKEDYIITTFQTVKNCMDTFIYDIFPDLANNDYKIMYSASSVFLSGMSISNPPLENFSFFVHGGENKIIINRSNSPTFKQTSLIFDNSTDQISIEYTCDETTAGVLFVYNFFILPGTTLNYTQGSCEKVETNIEYYNVLPTPTIAPIASQSDAFLISQTEQFTSSSVFSPLNVFTQSDEFTSSATISAHQTTAPTVDASNANIDSNSTSFELTKNGFLDDHENMFTQRSESSFVVSFHQREISITESSKLESSATLYFRAVQESSTITFSEDVTNSKVGVKSDNSPTVVLSKRENPLSFMNEISGGRVEIECAFQEEGGTLGLDGVDNRMGTFSLSVPMTIELVSFASIFMSQISSFRVTSRRERRARKLDDDGVNIEVRELISVNELSEASLLSNVDVNGNVTVYGDSFLTFEKNVKFSGNSVVEFALKKEIQKREKAVILAKQTLDTIPSKVVLSSLSDGEMIKVDDLPLIEAKSFPNCEAWRPKIEFKSGREGEIESKCEQVEGDYTVLYLSANEGIKPKKDDKLTAGVIAAIAASCVASVVLIALLVAYLFKRGHSTDISSYFSSQEDSIGL